MSHHHGRPRPSIRSMFTNLGRPMPLHRKLRLMVRNYWLRVQNRSDCCGHPGEPGC